MIIINNEELAQASFFAGKSLKKILELKASHTLSLIALNLSRTLVVYTIVCLKLDTIWVQIQWWWDVNWVHGMDNFLAYWQGFLTGTSAGFLIAIVLFIYLKAKK